MFKSICNVFRSISDATYAMSLAAELAVEKSEKRLADYKEEAAREIQHSKETREAARAQANKEVLESWEK